MKRCTNKKYIIKLPYTKNSISQCALIGYFFVYAEMYWPDRITKLSHEVSGRLHFFCVERLHHEQVPSEHYTLAHMYCWNSKFQYVHLFKPSSCSLLAVACSKGATSPIKLRFREEASGALVSFDGILHAMLLHKVTKNNIYLVTELNNTPQDQ